MQHKTPIMLITGSLGSGKTTLLKYILEAAPMRIAVLMNEFGEIAVDSRIIRGRNIDIIELAGGCVCCSMTGEFEAAVKEIIGNIRPDIIVVEATGVAESDSLVFEVEDNLPEVRLDSVLCIVDAYLSVRYPHVGYTSRTQIGSADIILLNKTDLVTADETELVELQTRKYNDRAAIIRTIHCKLDRNLLFGLSSGERPRPLLPPSSKGGQGGILHSGAEYQSFSWSSEKDLDEEKFVEFIRNLPENVFRAKGFVRFEGNGRLVNYVVGRGDFEEFETSMTELVFIGPDVHKVRPQILNNLEECEVK
ncbi:MAG: GTP-binding protein [Syntrophobacteraceae bacterium]